MTLSFLATVEELGRSIKIMTIKRDTYGIEYEIKYRDEKAHLYLNDIVKSRGSLLKRYVKFLFEMSPTHNYKIITHHLEGLLHV